MDSTCTGSQYTELYASAIFAFEPTVKEELRLQVGYVLKVFKEIDNFWYFGQNLHNRCTGQFPKDFVNLIELPEAKSNESLLFALDSFYPEVKDDLPFKKGDIIVLSRKVDDSWGYGKCHNKYGIFPLNYTQCIATSNSTSTVPSQFDVSSVICTVKATMPLTAQLNEELTFAVGDIISVTEIMPDNWARGQVGSASGIFPLSFTSYYDGAKGNSLEETPALVSQSKNNVWKKSPCTVTNKANSNLHSTFQNSFERDPLQHSTDSSGHLIGINSVNEASKVDSLLAVEKEITSFGKVVADYSYQRRNSDELSFEKGDVINVIEKKSDMWLYGKHNNSFGYIPHNYVTELPSIHATTDKHSVEHASMDLKGQLRNVVQESSNAEQKKHAEQAAVKKLLKHTDVRLVVDDFHASTDFEISLRIGDTVHVLQEISSEWCEVKNNLGNIGFAPNSCLQRVVINSSMKQNKTRLNFHVETKANVHQLGFRHADNVLQYVEDENNGIMGNNNHDKQSSCLSGASIASQIETHGSSKLPYSSQSSSVYHMNRSLSASHLKTKTNSKPINRSESMYGKVYSMERKKSLSENHPPLITDVRNSSYDKKSAASKLKDSNGKLSQTSENLRCSKQFESDSISTTSYDSNQSGSVSSGSGSQGRSSFNRRHSQKVSKQSDYNNDFNATQSTSLVSIKTPSNRKSYRSAPPPPSNTPQEDSCSSDKNPLQSDTSYHKGFSAPTKPPQPIVHSKLSQASKNEGKKPISCQQKEKIEKLRSEIEEQCRTQKELETLYNSSFDGKERLEIAEKKKFVVAKLRRLQAKLNNIIGDADYIYEAILQEDASETSENTRHSLAPLPVPPLEQSEDVKEKRRNKKNHVIQELIQTEEDYLLDVNITIEDIMKPLLERELPLDINVETLFGNIENIRDFSSQLLASLKEASLSRNHNEDADVGKVFIDHIPAMKDVYKIYCRNHDDSTALLEKYEEEPEFKVPVEECLSRVRNKVNAFDLGSFLIKPVQRILKYPLLLGELVKLTDVPQPSQSTDCYDHIIQAVKLIQNVANDINEDKRRKDLVRKYRKGRQDTSRLSGKMSRLSLHSVKKKSARISRRIGHVTGLNQPETVDERFNTVLQRFKDLEKAIKSFLQNSDQYATRCRDLLNLEYHLTAHINDLSASDHTATIVSYGNAMKKISEQSYRQFHDQMQLRVNSPLSMALVRFKAPWAIIDKRFDKLLDYENCLKNTDSKEKTQQMAKNVYEALNQQLLDELPKLCELAANLLERCAGLFVRLQIVFQRKMFEVLEPVYEMCKKEILVEVKDEDFNKTRIMEQFNFAYNQILLSMRNFTIIPASFCAMTTSSRSSLSSRNGSLKIPQIHSIVESQTQALQQELLNKYGRGDIFMATETFSSRDNVDISCNAKDVIAVIKRQDPLGHTEKWFCDNGVAKGFLPSSILKHLQQAEENPPSPHLKGHKSPTPSSRSNESIDSLHSPASSITPKRSSLSSSPYSIRQGLCDRFKNPDLADLSAEEESIMLEEAFREEDEMLDDDEYEENCNPRERYRVEFDFKARTSLELSVATSELVNLIVAHDLDGNSEWWLVSNVKGEQGYVPANYLNKTEYI